VLTAHRDYPDICPACGHYITKGQMYVLNGKEVRHYACKDRPNQLERPAPSPHAHPNGTRAAARKRRKERREARKQRHEIEQGRRQEYAEESDRMARFEHAILKDEG
jgi:hypothetical protein